MSGPTGRSLRDLTTLVDQVIVKELQKAEGVGRIQYAGGTARQIQIRIDPQRMASYGVGIDQVMDAIRQANQDVPAGLISNARNETLVRVEGKLKNVDDFSRIIVARRGGNVGISSLGSSGVGDSPVYLGQVATVVDGEQEAQSIGRNDGAPALTLGVYKIQDANIVETGEAVRKAIADLSKRLPPGVEIRTMYANSDWVKRSLDGVKHTLVEGGLLTVLIVFLFLRSWRSTIITGLTLPIAVMSTFIVLNMFHFTLNFMTMMALSLCIGLLIDDAIVVRENIVRHLHMGKSHRQAAEDGTNEIGLAVMATTFAIVAVFVPVAFMSGIVGKFFFSFGITVTAAVLVSLFVSFTLDPMLSSIWHDPGPKSRILRFAPLRILLDAFEHFIQWMHRVYGRLLGWALSARVYRMWLPSIVALIKPLLLVVYYPPSRALAFGAGAGSSHATHKRGTLRRAFAPRSMFRRATITPRGIVLWTAFGSFIAAFALLAAGKIGSEFIPDVDQSWISIRLTTPPGVSLEYADQKARQLEAAVADLPEIIATDVSVFGEDRNSVRVQLKLKPRAERQRSQKDIEKIIRDRVAAIPGVTASIGFNQAIFIAVLGPDVAKLNQITTEIAGEIGRIPGVVDLETSMKPGHAGAVDPAERRRRERPRAVGAEDRQRAAAARRRRDGRLLARVRRPELRGQRAAAEVGPHARVRHRRPAADDRQDDDRPERQRSFRSWCRCGRWRRSRSRRARRSSSGRTCSDARRSTRTRRVVRPATSASRRREDPEGARRRRCRPATASTSAASSRTRTSRRPPPAARCCSRSCSSTSSSRRSSRACCSRSRSWPRCRSR